ncbi:RluA family pseudouridine synthase [Bacillus sp. FJAT-27445]|uniref:RluA family pseudouridine synthase n=1 Tax=Bacillus sp. FJAT-27445 TaxID=1679166 RepID=UPI0007442D1A|nr:RluA family pseudouridine synthase [Bacillus sp. FJAT-27445]
MLDTKRVGNYLEVAIPALWDGITIAEIFKEKWRVPKKLSHHFRMEGKVLLKGERAGWETPLPAATKLHILLFEDTLPAVQPFYIDLGILYEDSHLLIVNKPPFITTHPNSPEDTETLVNAVAAHLLASGEGGNVQQIHRLDRDTSGAIIFAKHPLAGAVLDKMLEERAIKRTYLAGVQGTALKKKGTINESIGRDRHHPTRRRVSKTGLEAITHYKVLKAEPSKGLTWISCWLETGRTHQIRVHFSHIGHPLAGDELYGGQPIFNRPALHSSKVEFSHPITMEELIIHAPFLDNPPIFRGIDVGSI